MSERAWSFWVDRGGTFTDVVARDPDGIVRSLKLLSVNPERYRDAAVEGIRRLLADAPAGERRVAAVRMGTTVATNALLERRGEPTALVVTAGLKDALRIGTQQRPELFALDIRLPEMLYARVVEARERVSAQGDVVEPLDAQRLAADLASVRAEGIDSVAIVLLHGYRYPEHERQAGEIARRLGFSQVSLSHETIPLMKLIPRGDTTLVDAYLSPILRRYVASLRDGLDALLGAGAPLSFMQSHGGLAKADFFRGKDSILSGPAGGVIGMVATAREAGFENVLGFDMGGTSTDVSLFAGELERTGDVAIAGVRVAAPMLRIHTVAAGGGSIVRLEGGRLVVGPESAGASPGPACYRNGGPLTVTDANVLLGRVQPDFFPRAFGPDGDQPIDVDVVRRGFAALAREVTAATGVAQDAESIAAGAIRIAVERMANAIRRISIERGHDVTSFALSSFGGAGGQHACQVADALGIETIFIHPLAGVLSAYGMGLADLRTLRRRAVERRVEPEAMSAISDAFDALLREARDELLAQGAPAKAVEVEGRLGLKVEGSDTALPIAWAPGRPAEQALADFADAHARHFGFGAARRAVIAEWVEVECVARSARPRFERPRSPASAEPIDVRDVWVGGGRTRTPVHARDSLAAGSVIRGPALIVEANATTFVDDGWQASVGDAGELVLRRVVARAARERVAASADPIMLEVFNNLFMHVAEQMGVVLEQTAHSVNIKERLDFSCALFDPGGALIANAPHMPVHLGSMGDSVVRVLERFGASMAPGDAFMLNAPYDGGTHLPDVTVVSPVFGADRRIDFIVASRAHHADIGGITPGSMPPMSRSIHEEGVVVDGMQIVAAGRFLEDEVRELLAGGPYPARNPEQNVADLKAQLAANARGAAELRKIVARYGLDVVHAYMAHVKRNAEECVRAAIERLDDGAWSLELDSGDRIAVEVRVDRARRTAVVDFTGTSATSPSNLNAPPAIARAAVLYVFRTLVRQNIPLNAGCLEPLTIVLPEESLVNPRYPAAVVAGNVETSQCITDALLAALGACAASQGTMNNFTFGNARYQYYETLCGGAGAGPSFDGASAVHTHMTNSRLTDPEVLEWRYPVRLRRFEIRSGSGGDGRHRGGDGIVREIEFLEPMHAAILSNRRRVPPFGVAGGSAGLPGRNAVIRSSGEVVELGPIAALELGPGDRFRIETPGGGGFGRRRT
ncbi:MAG TPA: hydantoinase B/oxoprolinase family protein [Gammaproteobacteria bacterium]